MSLAQYQQRIDDELQEYETPYWHPLSQLAHIAEEVGEVARILNHKYGDKPKKPSEEHDDLADEIADILYSLICLANSENIKLDPALERTIAKLSTRDKGRFNKKEQ